MTKPVPMYRTKSLSKLNADSQGFIVYGIIYISNDYSTYDSETLKLVRKVNHLVEVFKATQTYQERLRAWCEQEIKVTRIWLGDTKRIIERSGSFGYEGNKPEPDLLLFIDPTNYSEILDFNLNNIRLHLEQIGSFESYKQRYTEHLKEHVNSVFYDKKLLTDLEEVKSNISPYNDWGWYGVTIKAWYDSFINKNDTLNKSDYQIWDLDQPLTELPLLSSSGQTRTPYLLNLIDRPTDIVNAAKAYFLQFQIPFLKGLRDERMERAIRESVEKVSVNNKTNTSIDNKEVIVDSDYEKSQLEDVDTVSETVTKKSKKKTAQITTKQQMILLNALGFLDASILVNLTTKHKAAILANLLNRSEQDIRGMLTYWGGRAPHKKYDCSNTDDEEKVIDLLTENNLEFIEKKKM